MTGGAGYLLVRVDASLRLRSYGPLEEPVGTIDSRRLAMVRDARVTGRAVMFRLPDGTTVAERCIGINGDRRGHRFTVALRPGWMGNVIKQIDVVRSPLVSERVA